MSYFVEVGLLHQVVAQSLVECGFSLIDNEEFLREMMKTFIDGEFRIRRDRSLVIERDTKIQKAYTAGVWSNHDGYAY